MREKLEKRFADGLTSFVADWIRLLEFPSISPDPSHESDCRACAQWLCEHLAGIGFEVELVETGSKPLVFGERRTRPDAPTVLFYGHYDVQPADPLEAWRSPPFVPTWRDGRLYARGAQDNKGQLTYALKAMQSLFELDAGVPNLKIVLEGEEECGSRGLAGILDTWRDRLAADVLMVCDTDQARSGAPAIVMGLRGIVGLTLDLGGPSHDLHSGLHGGLVPNPAQALAAVVASLHEADGRIAVDGFYDRVRSPSETERRLAADDPFDAAAYEAAIGVPPVGGESGLAPQERLGFRPSLDVNGLASGYGGEGLKTVIPAAARAKLTARLVPDQDPDACLDAIERHCRQRVPAGLRLTVRDRTSGGAGFRLDVESTLVSLARRILDGFTTRPAALLWEGASIPIVAKLAAASGAEPLLVGFGCEDDHIHAPNESFDLDRFKLGYLYVGMMLHALADRHGG